MNIGTRVFTWVYGQRVGRDRYGNTYYQERRPKAGRMTRRWVDYAGEVDGSKVPPEWNSWIHHTTDAPLSELNRRPWWKPHQPNLTGTPAAYRPAGHDYKGGVRAAATGDYKAWSPDDAPPALESGADAQQALIGSRQRTHGG